MDTQGIFNRTFFVLENILDLRSSKHNQIVSNVANVDTPNYKAFDLIIEEQMESITGETTDVHLSETHPGHLSGRKQNMNSATSRFSASPPLSIRGDGNTVDIDKTMADMAENNLMYNTLAQILSKKFEGLKSAIQEGGR